MTNFTRCDCVTPSQVVRIPISLYFGNAAVFKQHCQDLLLNSTKDEKEGFQFWLAMVLDMSSVRGFDSSGIEVLVEVIRVRTSSSLNLPRLFARPRPLAPMPVVPSRLVNLVLCRAFVSWWILMHPMSTGGTISWSVCDPCRLLRRYPGVSDGFGRLAGVCVSHRVVEFHHMGLSIAPDLQ